jgi:hypothetical protein
MLAQSLIALSVSSERKLLPEAYFSLLPTTNTRVYCSETGASRSPTVLRERQVRGGIYVDHTVA